MRCISLLLLGLISVTYALPAPSPGASQSRPSAATQAASRWTWKYYHQEPYTSRAGEKLKTNKKLFWKIQTLRQTPYYSGDIYHESDKDNSHYKSIQSYLPNPYKDKDYHYQAESQAIP
ncbi:hypothetical protein F5880DRAFT_1511173 [Lentinula raphanica]|nr:hypothetical protein F5880DRAFT_1511173 [Lentinula raphanica]